MRLRTKFVLLIGMLLLSVVASLAASWWALAVVHRETVRPFASVSGALESLGQIKQEAENQAIVVYSEEQWNGSLDRGVRPREGRGVRGPVDSLTKRNLSEGEFAALAAATNRAARLAAGVESDPSHDVRIGRLAWRDVKHRVSVAFMLEVEWFLRGSDDLGHQARLEAGSRLYDVHELIERTELRILSGANTEWVPFGEQLQQTVALWLASVLLASILAAILSVTLLQRWLNRPIAALRTAAARIAFGDLTHRIQVESRDELGLLSAEVNHMAQMVSTIQDERVQRERLAAIGSMVRRLVHNLRNPLSGIRGLAEVTRIDMEPKSDGRENLDLIMSTVDTFERWLNELLESTSPMTLDAREMMVRPFLDGIVQGHLAMAQTRNVRIEVRSDQAPVTATFDPRHLEHAVAALLSNAIEVSPQGTTVTIEARGSGNDGFWEIEVLDFGLGVPVAVRDLIFQPDFTTKPHGTGIGLAVAQQVARAHGGSITLRSEPKMGSEGHGACFLIRIPLRSNGESD